ncbi:MAG: ATP-binding protein [Actinomycetota bacterium]|nr:ATP-binding protein [Actinomycetota bacterium]
MSEARRLIRADMQSVGVDGPPLFDCLVAVTEACTNALLHGRSRASDDPAPVLEWAIDESRASFRIEDYSTEGWSRIAHPSRSEAAPKVEDLQVGGLGLGLMRDLMDQVDIHTGSVGTEVRLMKNLNAETTSTS